MAGEWKRVTVADVCDLVVDCVNKTAPIVEELTPYKMLRTTNIKGGRIDRENCRRVTLDTFQKWTRRADVRRGDVILTREAPVGEVGYVDFDDTVFLGQRLMQYRANPALLDPRFLHYTFLSKDLQNQFAAHDGSGSTVSHIRVGDCSKFLINLPPLPEQKAIARILGALDDKIELNRRMNATLEAMARALFQSWFVDFDPVHVLAGTKPEQPPFLSAEALTKAGFPNTFQDSELGPIPKGWEVRSLDRIANYLNGLALQKFPPGDGSTLPVIKIAQLRKGNCDGADRCNTDVPSEYIISDGDVLFSWSGSLEVELWCGGPGALNQHLFKVTSTEFPKWFYFLWTRYHLEDFRLTAASKATTMGHIQRKHLTAAKMLVPPADLILELNQIMAPIIDKIITNNLESRTLATLRDTLLPKLLCGELTVVGRDGGF